MKSIALKVVGFKDGQDSSECSDGETLNLLTWKFGKFLKKNSQDKNQPSNRYNSKKVNEFHSTNYTCFGCGKQGHFKVDCPNNESKETGATKKFEKIGKARRSYIAWQENDDSSSSSSSKEDEEANMCLMANEESQSSSVSSSTSATFENYRQLLDAFKETHEKVNRLALWNNWLKGLNN